MVRMHSTKPLKQANDLSRCIVLNRGQLDMPFQKQDETFGTSPVGTSWMASPHKETWHFLSDLHWLSCSNPSIFEDQMMFFQPGSPLRRLLFPIVDPASLTAFPDQTKHNILSMPRLMCLFWILAIFMEHAQWPLKLAGELQDLQHRLIRHGLDRSGSPMMLCWVLLRDDDSGGLHPRSWAIVRYISVIKPWDGDKQQNLTRLLHGYLLRDNTTEAQQRQYYGVMENMMTEVRTLGETAIS